MARSTTTRSSRTVSAELRSEMKAVTDRRRMSPAVRPTNLAPSDRSASAGRRVRGRAATSSMEDAFTGHGASGQCCLRSHSSRSLKAPGGCVHAGPQPADAIEAGLAGKTGEAQSQPPMLARDAESKGDPAYDRLD